MVRITRIAAVAVCALSLALPASAQLISSGGVLGNGTGSLAAPTDTPLVQIMNQSGSGIASGVGTALGFAPNTQGGFPTVPSGGLTANLPVIGGGSGSALAQGTVSGNTTVFGTTSGTLTFGHCVSIDSGHNLIDAGGACTTGGAGGTVGSGSVGQIPVYTGTTTVNGTATGTGVVTALGINVGSAGAVVVNDGALGTPSSGSAANLTNIPMGNASGTLTVAHGGTGDTTLTANLPLIGNGTSAIAQGTRSGNTTAFLTADGALTSGHCGQIDASGGIVDSGSACGSGGGSTGIANASGSALNTTGTISGSSSALTLASAQDFANAQGIRVNHAGAAFTKGQPSAATVTPLGAAGSTTYNYKIASVDGAGGVGAVIAAFSTTTGNATLNQLNFNLLNWTAGSGSPPGYAVYRQISGTYTLIGVTGNANTYFADIGYTAFPFLDWVPSTPAGGALADALVTTITSGGGTTSLVLAGSATTAATSQGVYHDDGAAIFAALSSSTTFPAGTFYVASAAGGSIPANVNVNGQFGNTIIQSVFVGGKIFVENATKNRISNLTFNLVPGSSAISSTGGSGGSLDHLICNGGGTGNAGTPDCIVGIDMAATTISYVNLNGWVSVLSPEVTGGVPPSIILTGTAAGACVADFLDHISMGNEGQFMVEQPSVAFHYCSNSSITSSILAADLGGVSTVALGGVGIEWDGQSEVLSVIGNQLLGFNANLSLDTGTNGNPAQLTAIGNLFDFCADQCIAINAGGWFNITGNQFVGEDHAPWNYAGDAGVFTASGVTSGPNIVTANTFNGFNGAGSIAIHFTSAMNNTTESGNQFTLSTNVSGGTGGTNSAIGANCSGAPTGSFSVFNGAIGHC